MPTYPLALALFDFLPNLAFLAAGVFLSRLARSGGAACARLMRLGAGLVFLGGTCKAVWKLLVTLGIADLAVLSEQQFAVSGAGFFCMLLAALLLARAWRPAAAPVTGQPALAALPLMAVWKIPLLAIMTLSSLGLTGILTTLAFRRGARLAGWALMLATLCTFGMAAMASGQQSLARQWAEEITNTLGQAALLVGAAGLDRRETP